MILLGHPSSLAHLNWSPLGRLFPQKGAFWGSRWVWLAGQGLGPLPHLLSYRAHLQKGGQSAACSLCGGWDLSWSSNEWPLPERKKWRPARTPERGQRTLSLPLRCQRPCGQRDPAQTWAAEGGARAGSPGPVGRVGPPAAGHLGGPVPLLLSPPTLMPTLLGMSRLTGTSSNDTEARTPP